MKNENKINTHYLSISYKVLVNKTIIHLILFIVEVYILLIQILETYYDNINSFKTNVKIYNPYTLLIKLIDKLNISFKFIIYFVAITIIIMNYYLLKNIRFKNNLSITIIVNITEIFLYRLLTLFIFNFLFLFTKLFLVINIIITLPYLYALFFHFNNNYLFLCFPSLINYPYDQFSMIIDLNLLIIKVFISMAFMISNPNISKLCFYISIFILFFLLVYLTYIMKKKSYYCMNNCNLNKFKYAIILSSCIIIIALIIPDKNYINNIYYQISSFNILILSLLFICYFYDPYRHSKIEKDDNIENVYYYLFILEKYRNNFLLEEKIEEHINICNKCNLCKKYNSYKKKNNNNDKLDLYNIIYNGEDLRFNIYNKIFKGIIKNGKASFLNNSFYLINLIYIYYLNIKDNNYNNLSNIELLYEIINEENSQYLDEYKLSINQIKNANYFLIKANKIICNIYEIFDVSSLQQKSVNFLKLAEELEQLELKEIKFDNSNRNNNINNIEGLPNCNNLLAICSLFYEELYNMPISNSGNFIRDNVNLLEDLVNHNNKNINQITLKIDILNFNVKIIRAGGVMNKYENENFFDFFPSLFKNNQIIDMKNILLNSNDDFITKPKNNNNKNKSKKKKNNNRKQYINFSFIIEEKKDNLILFNQLKLKLSFLLLSNLKLIIYLNGTYSLNKDIIVTEHLKEEERIVFFGNQEQINKLKFNKNYNYKDIFIKKIKNMKYFENEKLIEDSNIIINIKKYTIYHYLSSKKKILEKSNKKNKSKSEETNIEDEKNNLFDEYNELNIINEIASQASSSTTSISRNNLITNYRANKKIQNKENFTKKLTYTKFILLFSKIIFLFFIIFEIIFLILIQKDLVSKNFIYLLFKDYSHNFNILFFSILSLICIADSIDSNKCTNLMNEVTELSYNSINNSDLKYNYNDFINFTELMNAKIEILNQNLNDKLDVLNKYLAKFDDENYAKNLNSIVFFYKINQIEKNNKIIFTLSKENLHFSDFMKLMTSRFGIILKNYKFLETPIYILNKVGDKTFKNVFDKYKLDSSQEAIYLMILDYNNFANNLHLVISQFVKLIIKTKNNFKYIIYFFLNLNLLFVFVILIILFLFISIYLIIIFQILNDVHISLKTKLGQISLKEILRKKIDNLKLMLKFYENDIIVIIKDLNNTYNIYKDDYNLKVKEETKLLKKEGKNNVDYKNKDIGCSSIIKIFKKYNLYKYSKRKELYFYSLIFIFILSLSIYIITLYIWNLYFKKDNIVYIWVNANHKLATVTNRLMINLLLMFYNNETFNEISGGVEPDDYISFAYTNLTNAYKSYKYYNILSDIIVTKEKDINFDCEIFYRRLENDFYKQLKNKFINDEDKFFNTMNIFCNMSNIMIFKNYMTIYLQLFSKIKNIVENFQPENYNEIIKYIKKNEIGKIEITFLTSFIYLATFSFNNIKEVILTMDNKILENNIITGISFIFLLIILVFFISFVYIKNINYDCNKFLQARKVFKICDINE